MTAARASGRRFPARQQPARAATAAALAAAIAALATIATIATTCAYAQQRPDAGAIQRDLEPRRLEVPRAGPLLPATPSRPALKSDDTLPIRVTAVRISGNTALPTEQLLGLVREDLVGRTVTLAQLQAAAGKITAYYRARGFLLARAYIPQQRIDQDGAEIELAVIEGVLGKVTIDNRSRLSDAAVAGYSERLPPGAPLTVETFERTILLLSDEAGVGGVVPVLKAGEAIGSSDLALGIAAAPLASGNIEADNHGSRFTGEGRVTTQLNLASAFGRGESLSARITESFSGLTAGTFRASLPLGSDGLRLGLSYADTRYTLGRDFAALGASGTAQSAGASLSYPWMRSQRQNLSSTLSVESRRLADRIASTGSDSPKRTDSVALSLGGDLRDPLAANSVFAWNATVLSGRLAIGEVGARGADAGTAMAEGTYRKYTGQMLYLQQVTSALDLYVSLSAQLASKNLDSSEKFVLGGAQGVRAYPVGEATGDQGRLATVELRYALEDWRGATPRLVLFVDQGHTQISRNAFAAGSNGRSLGAVGAGVTLTKSSDYAMRLYAATKTGGHVATADVDRSNRVWVQVVKYF